MLVHLKTLGCRLNEAELETWAQAFQHAGHQITRNATEAQLIILNSCAVTNEAERKSRQLIRRLHRKNPTAKLVVSGCYASLNTDKVAAQLGVDLVIGNQEKSQLVPQVLHNLNFSSMPIAATESKEPALFSRGRQRAFVKVQDGCRYKCSFCIVTVARGDETSRAISTIINEINLLYSQGIQEVILTGVHLGGYGNDLQTNLYELIQNILAETTVPRLRLGSLEPWDLPANFFSLFQNPRLMPHLHLPLQSGSDSVLKRMARRCKTAEFAQIATQARAQIPNFNLTSDIIVGFPDETEAEWQQSLEFIQQIGFGKLHIFSYSAREGTAAAKFPNQLPNAIKKQRSQELHTLASQMQTTFMQSQLGQQQNVLWETQAEFNPDKSQQVFGYTEHYLKVALEIHADTQVENQILATKLISSQQDYVLGKLVAK